jgi:hypothetical protein
MEDGAAATAGKLRRKKIVSDQSSGSFQHDMNTHLDCCLKADLTAARGAINVRSIVYVRDVEED